ncbi:Helix-turn-helix domain protein [compost metagenome]
MTTPHHARFVSLGFAPGDLLTPEQVAAALALSKRTLAAWRSSRRNPLPYVKVGSRVRYRRQDVDAWLQNQVHTSNTEA